MGKDYESASEMFLQLASEQRLRILNTLLSKPYRITNLSKKLDATSQEIHRNLSRMSESGLVRKGLEDKYHITTSGKIMLSQMSLVTFLTKNKKFFDTHDLGLLSQKFNKRLGVLEECEHIKGVTKVLEKWKKIYSNANEYVLDIISESPSGLVDPLIKKLHKGIEYRHIISRELIEPEGRQNTLKKLGYYELLENGNIQRKKSNNISMIIIVNEKEAGVIFPTTLKEPDLRHMFYGTTAGFHEWCVDYFEFKWKKSTKLTSTKSMQDKE